MGLQTVFGVDLPNGDLGMADGLDDFDTLVYNTPGLVFDFNAENLIQEDGKPISGFEGKGSPIIAGTLNQTLVTRNDGHKAVRYVGGTPPDVRLMGKGTTAQTWLIVFSVTQAALTSGATKFLAAMYDSAGGSAVGTAQQYLFFTTAGGVDFASPINNGFNAKDATHNPVADALMVAMITLADDLHASGSMNAYEYIPITGGDNHEYLLGAPVFTPGGWNTLWIGAGGFGLANGWDGDICRMIGFDRSLRTGQYRERMLELRAKAIAKYTM